jgi:hypothetical protein
VKPSLEDNAMKMKPTAPAEVTEEDIRAYAYHLYEQSGRTPDRDTDNWLEAEACLRANIPAHSSHLRLHHHLARSASERPTAEEPRVTARPGKRATARTSASTPASSSATPGEREARKQAAGKV